MKKVLIVDDETIIRVTLRSIVPWEKYGFTIVKDFSSSVQALEYMKYNPVDLLITDMKMPEFTGIQLLDKLNEKTIMPVSIVLSGYNEFEMVRESFRLGAYDYILKADLNEANMERLLIKLNETCFAQIEIEDTTKKKENQGSKPEELEAGAYAVVLLEIDEFQNQAIRFGDKLREELETPMLELARQIPRVASRAKIRAIHPFQYVLYYKVVDKKQSGEYVISVVRQIQSVWHDYMNLTVSAAISNIVDLSQVMEALDEDIELLKLGVLHGKSSVIIGWENGKWLGLFSSIGKKYKELVTALHSADELLLVDLKSAFFIHMNHIGLEEAKEESLMLIAHLAMKFREYEDNFSMLFPEEINYAEKIGRLENVRELELWLNNYFRWVMNYMTNRVDSRQADLILRAKRFIGDNYVNPELTLKSIADYVGLNEKYFSSRFTKETGSTFSNYLTEIRIMKAKNLMNTTDLKMYEVSERVGYNNVEHFNRMFKRESGISPSDYKKSRK